MITTVVAIASRPDGSRTRPHRGACHPVLSPLACPTRRCEGTRDESPFANLLMLGANARSPLHDRRRFRRNVENAADVTYNPRRWRRYLARLRFHLELTVPGVSGGQILPHNDRSRRALACASGSQNREEERKEKEPSKGSTGAELLRAIFSLSESALEFGILHDDCTRRDTVFLNDRDERGEQNRSVGERREKSLAREWAGPIANPREDWRG